jgi:signal transduction histidine kinase/CheY-like chemotaxis protein
VRYYLESGDLGAEFEDLVRSFEAEGHNPATVHMSVGEYYAAVTHARIHQLLRAGASEQASRLPALRKAVGDLSASAKIPLSKAHLLVAEGYLAWFEDRTRTANKRLDEAERLANEQSCPWVLYSVARARAHMLRAQGKQGPALDQARVARLFAKEHGAVTRARWISEEMGLAEGDRGSTRLTSSRRSSSSRAHRQLTALLHVVSAPRRDLKIEEQAERILEELIDSFGANGGAIWFQPEASARGTTAWLKHAKASSAPLDEPRMALLRSVRESGLPWPTLEGDDPMRMREHRPFDAARLIAFPLFLYERPVGALLIERDRPNPPFETNDRNLLQLLSHQVPIALEIARLLSERDQLHASLQHAKKMEAMGTLAGGLAHDFNNMLAAMSAALTTVQERAALDAEIMAELDVIGHATARAAQLTGQLLSFSRNQPVRARPQSLNELVGSLEPMLRRVLGERIELTLALGAATDTVEVDQGSFDQALVNLVINARDAMPRGGLLSIKTGNVTLSDHAARGTNLAPGDYVELVVADTGEGMSAEIQSRIFEPFFTTKGVGRGSGLGLAMVYAFTRNSGGSVDVSSELGKGTKFRFLFRSVDRLRSQRSRSVISPPPPRALPQGDPPGPQTPPHNPATRKPESSPDTILVVDDDDLVRRSIAKTLERHGYRVVAASGSVEALDAARELGARIGLVILDVLMPGLNGPDLNRKLSDLKLPAKVLFVSGALESTDVAAHMLLEKPFTQTTLLDRVRKLMPS